MTNGPEIFDYSDYRQFLKDTFQWRKLTNPQYSETAFIRQAGLGKNSRGYFQLIINGKRNLSFKSIIGFAQALHLEEKRTYYFENLVLFNQAKKSCDKDFFFRRLEQALALHKKAKVFHLFSSQYHYFARWYYVAIRECLAMDDAQSDPKWIVDQLKQKVTLAQVKEAIADLELLGMIKKVGNKYLQNAGLVEFKDNPANEVAARRFHHEMMALAQAALQEEDYSQRSTSAVLLCCDRKYFDEIRNEIAEFRQQLMAKYAAATGTKDTVIAANFQLFHLTKGNNQ